MKNLSTVTLIDEFLSHHRILIVETTVKLHENNEQRNKNMCMLVFMKQCINVCSVK